MKATALQLEHKYFLPGEERYGAGSPERKERYV